MAFFRRSTARSYDLLSKYNWYVPGWKGLLGLALMFILGAVLGSIASIVVMTVFGSQENAMAYAMLVSYPLMFIPAMIYTSVKSQMNSVFGSGVAMDSSNFKPLRGLTAAVIVAIAVIAGQIVLDPLNSILPEMDEKTRMAMDMLTKGPLWISILCASIFAPFFEEWLCRGMILRSLLQMKKLHPAVAIVISGAFFAIIHGNIWQGIAAFLIGCFLGWVYYRTGSLKLTMLMHCVNNTVAIVTSRIPALGDCDSFSEAIPDKRIYWCLVASAVLLFAVAVIALNKVKPLGRQGSCNIISPEESK